MNEKWRGAHILVNNVGMSPIAPPSIETSKELFDKIIAVNVRSVIRLSSLFRAQMHSRDGGAIAASSTSTGVAM